MASKKRQKIEPEFASARRKPGALDIAAGNRKPAKARKGKSRRGVGLRGLLGGVFYWGVIASIWGVVAVGGLVAWYGMRMPSATSWEIPDRPPNVKIVDVNGRLVANRGMTGGEAVGLQDISPYVPQAVIAIEDRRFYSHFGVDPIGLARAMATNLASGRLVQGGSTLTQQLAKNLFLKPERTLERKVQEVLLAVWLESKYSKDQILEMYLNRVYFGSGAYGVEAAARRYFSKPARDVSLSEAALLAGLLKAPSRLSPARDPKAANDRAQLVLAAMGEQGMISDNEIASAISNPPTRAAAHWNGSEHYVADSVMSELPELIGELRDDVIVDTTIDLDLQQLAEASIHQLINANQAARKVSQGALVSIDSSGAVRAMVGGYDYANSQFDRATEARRQPGSTFKPFVYLAALEQGRTPQSVRNDAPVRIGKWTPENYNGKYYGEVTLATALSKSLNSVAAQLAQEVGPRTVVETARRLGITSELAANASLALGTSEVTLLEMVSAYVPFANGGYRPPVHAIKRITTTEGKIIYEYRPDQIPRVIRPEIVGQMNAMMAQTLKEGTGKSAYFGWPAAGKTGTTQNSRDAWFIGYTANLTTGVWFGNDDGAPMNKVTGGSLPASAWKIFMEAAHAGVPVAQLPGTAGAAVITPGPLSTTLPPIETIDDSAAELAPPANLTSGEVTASVPVPVWRGSNGEPRTVDVQIPQAEERATRSEGPVPPGDIGTVAKQTTLFDILMGN